MASKGLKRKQLASNTGDVLPTGTVSGGQFGHH